MPVPIPRRLVLGLVVTVLSLASIALPSSPANAWGVRSHCDGHTILTHTQTIDAFAGHHMDVYLHGCSTIGTATVGPHLIWTQRPRISFRSSSPFGALETVKVSVPPFFYDAAKCSSGSTYYCQVRYRWQVHQCVKGSGGVFCNDFTFGVKYRLVGTQVCMVGGANVCTGWKRW